MTVDKINVDATIKQVKNLLATEDGMSPTLKASLETLLLLVTILLSRLGLNSKNSSKPPSADPNRTKTPRVKNGRKPGGQPGHAGTTLAPVSDPDEINIIPIDRTTIPPGQYRDAGYESRQVIDLDIGRFVTEWQAQVLEDSQGKRYVASFPEGVTRPVQYGIGVKVNSVYMSQHQLIPYNRVEDHFREQLQIPVSNGSIGNFNKEAYDRLEPFDQWLGKQLALSPLIHVDETSINIGGVLRWLHNASNDKYTCFYPHPKRGSEAMDEMGILPAFRGIMCHDHWKPYYKYGATHSLCNAHHLRELERAKEQDGQQWACQMSALLKEINVATQKAGGRLALTASEHYRQRYRDLLHEAEKECPAPDETNRKGRRGKIPRSKSRNLLERLRDFESDVLRFMDDENVPFSNNQAENDLRMTKVQQKISGCFRSMEGAKIFCRIRSYLSTCRKHGVTATEALRLLFEGKAPPFMASEQAL
ncbi:MAG: IS66 family transposase [Deltaproteobacteria bacterium]|nr:IS66 family transposase [Deltaproteobacteria bacterium]OIP44675.1 MAG: IS66 family transposase [Desulfobacterales bacterium CG2_30_60_27]